MPTHPATPATDLTALLADPALAPVHDLLADPDVLHFECTAASTTLTTLTGGPRTLTADPSSRATHPRSGVLEDDAAVEAAAAALLRHPDLDGPDLRPLSPLTPCRTRTLHAAGLLVHAVHASALADGRSHLSVRKLARTNSTMSWLLSQQVLTEQMATLLARAFAGGACLAVTGSTGSGKTTVLSALLGELPYGHRVVTVENHPELQVRPGAAVQLLTRDDEHRRVDLPALVRTALHLRAQTLVIGDVLDEPSVRVVHAAAAAGSAVAFAMQAASARAAVQRLEHQTGLRDAAAWLDLIVTVTRDMGGARRVTDISQVSSDGSLRTLWRWNEDTSSFEHCADPSRALRRRISLD